MYIKLAVITLIFQLVAGTPFDQNGRSIDLMGGLLGNGMGGMGGMGPFNGPYGNPGAYNPMMGSGFNMGMPGAGNFPPNMGGMGYPGNINGGFPGAGGFNSYPGGMNGMMGGYPPTFQNGGPGMYGPFNGMYGNRPFRTAEEKSD